jgi:hypothetical protein
MNTDFLHRSIKNHPNDLLGGTALRSTEYLVMHFGAIVSLRVLEHASNALQGLSFMLGYAQRMHHNSFGNFLGHGNLKAIMGCWFLIVIKSVRVISKLSSHCWVVVCIFTSWHCLSDIRIGF